LPGTAYSTISSKKPAVTSMSASTRNARLSCGHVLMLAMPSDSMPAREYESK